MDWSTFEIQWRTRDQILLTAAQDRIQDKETGVAAFFVLMVLAIGAQYCKSQNPAGLLPPHDYYLLAQPYLRWIVQLHNLANVQGSSPTVRRCSSIRLASARHLLATRYSRTIDLVHLGSHNPPVSMSPDFLGTSTDHQVYWPWASPSSNASQRHALCR